MPAAFALLEALPADKPATAVLVTSHGAKSRPAPAGAPATSLVWLDLAEMLEMLSDLHPAAGTAAYLFGERHLIRTAEELLVAGGLDHDAVASKPTGEATSPTPATVSRPSTELGSSRTGGGLRHQPHGAKDDSFPPRRKRANRDACVPCEQSGVPLSDTVSHGTAATSTRFW
jgi:hypothetical protein